MSGSEEQVEIVADRIAWFLPAQQSHEDVRDPRDKHAHYRRGNDDQDEYQRADSIANDPADGNGGNIVPGAIVDTGVGAPNDCRTHRRLPAGPNPGTEVAKEVPAT